MSWLILILSGSLEAVWAAALHRTSQATGRRRIAPAAVFLISVLASTGGLAIAMQSIPTGTAYAMAAKVEPATAVRILLLGGIAASVVGLKLVA